MTKYRQVDFRRMADTGMATSITRFSEEKITELVNKEHGLEPEGISFGTYGMNGALLKGRESGAMYVVIGRGANLFRLV